jgi:hypothetical protein
VVIKYFSHFCIRKNEYQADFMKICHLADMLLIAAIITAGCKNEQASLNQKITVMEKQDGTIKLALVQMNVVGGELDINLEHAAERIARAANEGANLALLPDVMDLGWTHPAEKMADPIPGGKIFENLAAAAVQNQIYLVARIVEKDGDKTYNSAVLISPDGNEVMQAPYGADADTIIYIDVEIRERPAWGTDWNEYWNKEK